MCHLYPHKNVKLLWKFFYINKLIALYSLCVTNTTKWTPKQKPSKFSSCQVVTRTAYLNFCSIRIHKGLGLWIYLWHRPWPRSSRLDLEVLALALRMWPWRHHWHGWWCCHFLTTSLAWLMVLSFLDDITGVVDGVVISWPHHWRGWWCCHFLTTSLMWLMLLLFLACNSRLCARVCVPELKLVVS